MSNGPQWIGLDVGGSGARAARVEQGEDGLRLVGELRELEWDDGFTPLPIREQLRYPGEIPAMEEVAAGARMARLAELITSCAGEGPFSCFVSAPGLRTEDGFGVVAWRNGPRRSTFIGDLELALRAAHEGEVHALDAICPDSVACAMGELHAEGGSLRGVANGLCIAGGSGVGEALIVEGRCWALDEIEPALPRAWELRAAEGASIEDHVAPGRTLRAWHAAGWEGCPEGRSDEEAHALMDARDRGVGRLVERAHSWFRARGLELERVVISQTLGRLYSLDEARLACVAAELDGVELVASSLRAAPLAGAVVKGTNETT